MGHDLEEQVFLKVSKSTWKISFDVLEVHHCHVRSEVNGC
jgi:hypothetical protein